MVWRPDASDTWIRAEDRLIRLPQLLAAGVS